MASSIKYDVAIVGAGISGSIVAKELAKQGYSVLVLEAGTAKELSYGKYRDYLHHYYKNLIKIPNSPYPNNPNAPQPLVTDAAPIAPDKPDTTGYFVQKGPTPFQSSYTRSQGGTTLHWLGTCLRMLPTDFKEKTLYGHGRDWPVSYREMMPYYRMAEGEIGVSADVEEQQFHGLQFEPGYVYPMRKIPQSYLDQKFGSWINGMEFKYEGERHKVNVVSTPQGRNSTPNPKYNNGEGYQPRGAVGADDLGQRCEGNSACVPICPVQAKYNALKTLKNAVDHGVEVRSQCVVSSIDWDRSSGKVNHLSYKRYKSTDSAEYVEETATASLYVLAAHAVENAKLMLASDMESTSKLVGKNLMDHPVLLTWALAPEAIGAFRGPGSTSGIPSLRDGAFRANRSGFRMEIGNWGWNWPTGAPYAQLATAVSSDKLFGKELRHHMFTLVQKMHRFGFLIEQEPQESNCVTIDPKYKDKLGNFRPVIQYDLNDYEKDGMLAARELSRQIYQKSGCTDYTEYDSSRPGFLKWKGEQLWWQGAGHLAGTHVMGDSKDSSVVSPDQRCWDYPNLFLVGCGNMPTVGTSNPTLTMTALTFKAVESISRELKSLSITA